MGGFESLRCDDSQKAARVSLLDTLTTTLQFYRLFRHVIQSKVGTQSTLSQSGTEHLRQTQLIATSLPPELREISIGLQAWLSGAF